MTLTGRHERRVIEVLALAMLIGAAGSVVAAAQAPSAAPMPTMAPGRADTAVARFVWADGSGPRPATLRVVPGTVAFGDMVTVVVDLAPGSGLDTSRGLGVDVAWLEPATAAASREVAAAMAALPPASGPRIVTHWRVYRLGPWRAAWGDGAPGPALVVEGRLEDEQPFLPVRDPRQPGGLPRWLPWLLGAVAAAVAVWWLWRRLRGRPAARRAHDQPLPPVAWIAAAHALHELDLAAAQTGPGGSVDGRRYLDQLAAIVRRFLADRLHVAATEMTAAEVAARARAAGWPESAFADLVVVLETSDSLRYAPPAVSSQRCRECLLAVLAGIEHLHEEPRWSPVAPASLAAARAAWQELRARHPWRPTAPVGGANGGGGAC